MFVQLIDIARLDSEEAAQANGEYQDLVAGVEFLDLKDPWLL